MVTHYGAAGKPGGKRRKQASITASGETGLLDSINFAIQRFGNATAIKKARSMDTSDYETIRKLFDDYLRMYASRDDRLTTYFSEDFSGFTGGGDFLVKDREEWVSITRQDFAQVKDPLRIELKDLAIQSLAETIAVTTGFFTIHLPIKDHILSRETARLVLIFRKESAGWKITHSSISIPYYLVREGEVYPLKELVDRNKMLEELVAERTIQLSTANDHLQQTNEALAREIADRKLADDALQRSEERYRSIVHASPDDITITDQEGRILIVSPAAYSIFGYEQGDEFLGHPLTDYIIPEDRDRAIAQIALKRQGVITGPTEYRGLRKDGSTFDIEVNSEFIRDAEGSPTSMVVIIRDITERKQAEAEREKLEVQNRQLQKAESLGRMAGAIAHHFNNQLGAVMGNLDLALMELSQGADPREKITAAMKASNEAAKMSGLMLTYLGQSFDKHEPLDLSETCRRTLPMLQALLSGDMALETDFPSPGPVISANANQIQQVLTNLANNAREAVGESRGAIHLSVQTVSPAKIPTEHRHPIDWQPQDNAYACLEVTDTGGGIEDKDIENLFDPFFSSKFTGRGMGLAVVMGIVRAHGGVVTVESEPGRGSIFRVFFPVSGDAVLRQPNQAGDDGDTLISELSSTEGEGSGKVLLVEDEDRVREMAAAMLKRLGFAVLEAKDGVDALEVFRQRRDKIRFVLCDLTMPRMNGWETLTALRKFVPDIPVILTSGYDKSQVMAGDHPEWPQVFLGKPYKFKELGDAIDQALVSNPNARTG
jgi:two-component system, cell cycle sensor histidine kinase and response regulator CckA